MMPKSVRFGRFLIESKLPITHEERRILNRRTCPAIALVWRKTLAGTWRIRELVLHQKEGAATDKRFLGKELSGSPRVSHHV